MNKKPEKISDFYLSAFLAQLRDEGYSIFLLMGNKLPSPLQDISEGLASNWYNTGVSSYPRPPNFPNYDADLEEALRLSMEGDGTDLKIKKGKEGNDSSKMESFSGIGYTFHTVTPVGAIINSSTNVKMPILDTSKPSTFIQIKYIDGTKEKVQLNHIHTVSFF